MPGQPSLGSMAAPMLDRGVATHEQLRPHIKRAIHGQIYTWLGKRLSGGLVLDAGCGEGVGTAHLAQTADKVIGIDNDQTSISRASRRILRDNIEFITMDCQHIAFPDETFDLVIANALLEYLTDVSRFVGEAHRILAPGGVFVCGTKNLERSLKDRNGAPLYENHLQEFTSATLNEALSSHFSDAVIYGERMNSRSEKYIMDNRTLFLERILVSTRLKHRIPLGLRHSLRHAITGVDVASITENDFEISLDEVNQSLYIIGYCQKK